MPFLVAFAQTLQWIIYVVDAIAIIAVACLIIMLMSKISSSKKSVIEAQQHSTNAKTSIETRTQVHKKLVSPTNRTEVIKSNNERKTVTSNDTLKFQEDKKTKTLYELWEKRNVTKKCLTATNDENPDLEWVKIYKPPYGNGKFYGFVKTNNARETVNGEIYFAERAIWREIE